MDRKAFLKTVCGAGVCSCLARLVAPVEAMAEGQAIDQRLAFARYQVAKLVGFMAAGPAVPACIEFLERTGRECAKVGGLAARFAGDPEAYFATSRNAWGTEFQWDKVKDIVTVAVAEGPCGCALVDRTRMPAFWCNCSVGYQKESFSAVFGRPVQVTLKESKLSGGKRCVFEVRIGPSA